MCMGKSKVNLGKENEWLCPYMLGEGSCVGNLPDCPPDPVIDHPPNMCLRPPSSQAVLNPHPAQFWPRAQPCTAKHNENWRQMDCGQGWHTVVPNGQGAARWKNDQRKDTHVHWHAHCPRAAASGRARTRTQGPWLWTQSPPWVGHVTLSTALSLRVPIRNMGHWLSPSALQMLEEMFQPRGAGDSSTAYLSRAWALVSAEVGFNQMPPLLYLPWGLNAIVIILFLLPHWITMFLACISGIFLHSTWQLCYFGLKTNFYSCIAYSLQRLSDRSYRDK